MSITDFLNARIAEDESVVRAAIDTQAPDDWENPTQTQNHYPADIAFWDRVTPARVLVECAAKRVIVEECLNVQANPWDYADAIYTAEVAVYALAAVYADHPDYLDEWRVGA